MKTKDVTALKEAKSKLQNPNFGIKITNLIGTPIEKGYKALPQKWQKKVALISNDVLMKIVEPIANNMENGYKPANNFMHKIFVTATGVAGGAFGLPALPFELPISTGIIFRSITDIARSEGHDIHSLDVKLSCLEVFALGGRTKKDDASENAYWVIRAALAKSVTEASNYIASKETVKQTAPQIIKLVTSIGSRFGVIVSEEVAAKAVPGIGAVTGGAINYMFMSHFQQMAEGHFAVKRLENIYGSETVKKAYDKIIIN